MQTRQPITDSRTGPVNVLLTSVGRRAYLVHYFKHAVGRGGLVVAANSSPDSAGMLAADVAVVVPRANDPRFIDVLLDLCERYSIRLLMSLHDWEAPFIAGHRGRFLRLGTVPVVSDPDVTETCLDKWATFAFARQAGWRTPETFVSLAAAEEALGSGLLTFPLILKPRRGQGSVAVEIVNDLHELRCQYEHLAAKTVSMESNGITVRDAGAPLVIQQYIRGVDYDLEVVNDLEGNYVSVMAKKKLSSRAGECELAETVEEPRLTALGRHIGTAVGQRGVLDVDIVDAGGVLYVLELNPRFGGCYPFSHMAGADLPAAYVAWVQGRKPDPSWLRARPGVKCFKDFTFVLDTRGRAETARPEDVPELQRLSSGA